MKKSHFYHIRTWGAFANGTWTIIRAILKENAVRRFELIDPSVIEENVHLSEQIVGSMSCDEVVEEYDGHGGVTYSVRFREENYV